MYILNFTLLVVCFLYLSFCDFKDSRKLFTYVDASKSKIKFQNIIIENDSLNVIKFQYIYNGGGVGIGDFNNDGLPDIVFSGNQVSSKLYLNMGNLNFQDISDQAHFRTQSWVTGVSIVDINSDGWDDIYLSVGGNDCNNDCNNLLFVHQGLNKDGIPLFEQQAEQYKLEDGLYSQQALFFDFDNDGDLDVYIAHNGNVSFEKNNPIPKRYFPKHLRDYLLRNDTKQGVSHPVFTNVSNMLGITHQGFSLGIAISDFNNDGFQDIYVSNDFISEDLLYINNGINKQGYHLGFREANKEFTCHQTYNAMGVDIADINNDKYPDVVVVDMLPYNYKRQKRMVGMLNYDKYLLAKKNDYTSQFVHNTLQLNNGFIDDSMLLASEIGFQSGISATDWSWAPLIADYDNDGDKDIFITNGYSKDITDLDFINFSITRRMFGTPDEKQQKLIHLIDNSPAVPLPNFLFRNEGEAKFINISDKWIKKQNSLSNGASYSDLDNDGDLDLIVNNINDEAFILENHTSELGSHHYLKLKLIGTKKNKHAIGAKATVWFGEKVQYKYQSVVRGYLSSVDPILHFGLSSSLWIDSLKVMWPNGASSRLYNIKADTMISLHNKNGILRKKKIKEIPPYNFIADNKLMTYSHKDHHHHDFSLQHLFMRQYSKHSPCLAVGNIDSKKGDEIFIGGSRGESSQIWAQGFDKKFFLKQKLDSQYNDTDAVFEDIDGDGDLDLYVASGGIELNTSSLNYQDRIYINNGKGFFTKAENILPKYYETSSCISPKDFDKDGDIDFFIGARINRKYYPHTPQSQLLKNNNNILELSKDEDITNVGMVTDAVWADIDKDGWDDLIIVGEWMDITIFLNKKGKLLKTNLHFKNKLGEKLTAYGWWNCIKVADFDKDGDLDFIVGNQGNNYYITPEEEFPIYIYNKDFDKNGSIDPIIGAYYNNDLEVKTLMPFHSRDDIVGQINKLKNEYYTYEDFSEVDFYNLLNISTIENETFKATTFLSSYMENIGNLNFIIRPLPEECQVAPINDILVKDIDGDDYLDVLLVGNDYYAESKFGTLDGLMGLYLKGSKNGFNVIKSNVSGFYVPGQSNHIRFFTSKQNKEYVIASQSDDAIKIFSIVNY